MPVTALALVLVAALLHAFWNIVAKRSGGGAHFVLLSSVMVVVVWSPLGLWMAWQHVPAWGWQQWGLVAASALVHVGYFNVLLAGYRAADLTVVYPVARGTGPLVSATVAAWWLDEHLGVAGLAGVLGVVGGVVLIAGGPKLFAALMGRGGQDAAAAARVRAGVAWGAATGLLIAGYTLVDGYAVKVALMSPILVDYLGNALRVPMMLPVALLDREGFVREARALWKGALVLAIASPVAYTLVLYAATLAPLSRVAPAREVSMLVAALIGGHLLGEGDRAWRVAGALCMAGGVALLAW